MFTPDLIHTYYQAWLDGNRAMVESLLDDTFSFASPEDSYPSREAFLEACWHLHEGFEQMEVLQQCHQENRAWIAYRVGDMVIGEYLVLGAGRIRSICVSFGVTVIDDATGILWRRT